MDQKPSPLGTPREWAQDLGLATIIGVFLGVIGPFGSYYGGSLEVRIAYWVANLWIGFAIMATVVRTAFLAAMRLDLPPWFTIAAGVAIGALPLGFLIAVFSAWFWPGNHGHISSITAWYGQTLAIGEPCAFGYYLIGVLKGNNPPLRWRATVAEASTQTPAAPSAMTSAFLDRLPPRLGRDLLALQMEDHYVRAHTVAGSDLILTSLKDAIAELQDVEGMQVHRSWWVARRAVDVAAPNGRNLSLRLVNGLEAPVSRPTVAKLKAAGWITDA